MIVDVGLSAVERGYGFVAQTLGDSLEGRAIALMDFGDVTTRLDLLLTVAQFTAANRISAAVFSRKTCVPVMASIIAKPKRSSAVGIYRRIMSRICWNRSVRRWRGKPLAVLNSVCQPNWGWTA